MSESTVAQRIRLEAARLQCQMWRNNVGACEDKNGRHIRYGLCNDSKQLNTRIKSSDLIGITPMLVTYEMVGTTVGIFTAVETKRENWVFRQSDDRAVAQAAFHQIVRDVGGNAGFARNIQDFYNIINRV